MEGAYDAVVVGSGFGGGITACRLAERGWRVCVLERGRRFTPGDFPDRPEQAPRMFWHPRHNPGGMFDLRIMRDVAVLTGTGVGGGSLVYANVQLRPPPDLFDDPAWPAGIDYEELRRYYDRTEEALDPRETPADPALAKVRAFDAMAAHAGQTPSRLPIAVHFGEPRRHPFSGVPQQGCTNLGRCDIGCPRNARNTVDITYIARAEAYGAEIYPLHEVLEIHPPAQGGGQWRVTYRDLQYRIDGEVAAPVLVLAAGSLGTTRLLLTNRRRLPKLSAALGSRFSGNGDALALALDPKAEGVAGARTELGPTMTSRVDYTAHRGFMVADGGLPANFSFLLQIVRGVRAITGLGRVALAAKSVAARLGISDRHVTHRNLGLDMRTAPIGDSLVFLMIGRGRPRDGCASRRCSVALTSAGASPTAPSCSRACAARRVSSPTPPARPRSSRWTPGRWGSSSPCIRSAAVRWRTTAPRRGRRRRQGPRLRRPLRARRIDRADGARRQPVQDDRGARRAGR